MFQAHVYASSFLRRYASILLYCVSHLFCSESCSKVCSELTSNCNATVPNPEVDLKNDVIQRFLTTELVCDICWVVVMWIVKFSILAFYWRLFSARSRSLRVIIWALVVLVTCWGIIVVRPRLSDLKLMSTGNSIRRFVILI